MTNTTIPTIPVIPMDAEVDLIARVEAARNAKGTSPFVGIATPRGTLMLRRDVLKKSLAGLRVIEAELVEPENKGTDRYHGMIRGNFRHDPKDNNDFAYYRAKLAIRVYAVGERVKATRLYIHQPWKLGAGVMHPLLESWQRANMRKWGVCDCHNFSRRKTCSHVETATRPKPNKWEKAIVKLQKEMPREWRPGNPAVEMCDRPEAGDSLRQQWREWTLQKNARRKVMALARRGTKDLSSARIYAEVSKLTASHIVMTNHEEYFRAASDAKPTPHYEIMTDPINVKKWGALTAYERDRGTPDIFAYFNKLWQFCGLASKPAGYDHGPNWGAKHYKSWLADLHTRKQLISQIAAIRAEMPEVKTKTTTHKDDFDVAADGTVTNKVKDNSTKKGEPLCQPKMPTQ